MLKLDACLAAALVLAILFALREAWAVFREVMQRTREEVRAHALKIRRFVGRIALVVIACGPALYHGLDLTERLIEGHGPAAVHYPVAIADKTV